MTTFLQRLRMGFTGFYNGFTDPESQSRDMTHETRLDLYAQRWMYYKSMMFSTRNGRDWSAYLSSRELYKHTRLIYNKAPNVADFYNDKIWQAAQNEEFESLVTPLSDKTDEPIIRAVAQLDQWGNAQTSFQLIKRWCSVTGNVLVEGIDDLERGKILHKTQWPGHVKEIDLNDTGDVQGYTLEYPVYDKIAKTTYTYKKIVTKESFSYFRDDRPFVPEGKTSVEEVNPYGFCFAVWLRHIEDGSDFGVPACDNLDKLDNVNSLASHIDDFIHKAVESPKIVSTSGEVLPMIGATGTTASGGSVTPQDPRLNWMVLKTTEGATVHDLLGILDLASVSPELKRQLDSFENDYPELQADSIIRENSQLSGAALERMLGPAQSRLDGVQANYNQQLIKLRQMQISVAGMRTRNGWTRLTDQQREFAPFDLQSYQDGKLNFNLKRSLLVQNTEAETEDVLKKKADRAIALEPMTGRKEALNIAGYSDAQIKDIMAVEAPPPNVVLVGTPENRQLGEGAAVN